MARDEPGGRRPTTGPRAGRSRTGPGVSPLRDAEQLVTNFSRRYAGVSATVRALVPVQQRSRPTAVLDLGGLDLDGRVGISDVLRHGWRPPAETPHRVWHARRSHELALGLVCRDLLRQPWKLVYTSPTPRRHGVLWRWIVRRSDAVIAVTERAASYLDWYTAVVPHGVDVNAFVPAENRREAWRSGGLPGRYGIGIFGRIRRAKGTDLFVDAMCDVLPRHPEFTAVVAGFCKPADRQFLNDLETRIREADLTDRIVFLGDLTPPEILRWYQRISLCVAPPRSEGFGLTPLEAMACGAAVVTSREGAFPRLVVPGLNGLLVDTGDLPALVRAIDGLLADPGELERLGRRARRHVVEHHTVEDEVAGIYAVYDGLR